MSTHAEDFHFDLPTELIAQRPAPRRTASRLLLVDRGEGLAGEAAFSDLPALLRPGDLLVVNDSRVLPARLRMRREPGGGRVELLLVRPEADRSWIAMARPGRRLRPGGLLVAEEGKGSVVVEERLDGGYVRIRGREAPLSELAEHLGETPLPPYILRGPQTDSELAADDRERYQTVYARESGSVAAPTAGLHFDDELLERLADAGVGLARVTLHVGPGTFRPPDENDLRRGRLHAEVFRCPAAVSAAIAATRLRGGRVIAVGTTALRVIETVARLDLDAAGGDRRRWEAGPGDPDPVFTGEAMRTPEGWEVAGMTRLFLRPPQEVGAADGLITNFHLPGSSLLMLIASFSGPGVWRPVYDHAVAEGYRFYSYGDAMFIRPTAAGGDPRTEAREET